MGKIKSTLDIVMERTKDLTMTREDRDVLEKKELTDRVRGWIQQLVDRKSSVEELKAEYDGESARRPVLREILHRELLAHVDPSAETLHVLLQAWEEVLGLDSAPIRQAVDAYKDSMEAARKDHEASILSLLAGTGISGTAVIPNVQADSRWTAVLEGLKGSLAASLQRV